MHDAGTVETGSRTTRAAAPGGVASSRPRPGLALLVLAAAQLMVVLDATIVNVALPHIQRALGFSGAGLEWVVNAYALAFGGLLLLGGRAGDLLGRRRMFITGLLLFSAASLAGGLATSQAWLLAARAVQGAGAAIVAPTALALIATTFPHRTPARPVRPARDHDRNHGSGRAGLRPVQRRDQPGRDIALGRRQGSSRADGRRGPARGVRGHRDAQRSQIGRASWR